MPLPYTLLIRWGAILTFVLLLVGAGFKCGTARGEAKLEAKAHDLMVCGFDRDAMAQALGEVNAIADRAKRDAAAQAVYAVEAVRQADKDRATFDKKLGSVEDALERAKRTPVCRAQLEAQSCAAFN